MDPYSTPSTIVPDETTPDGRTGNMNATGCGELVGHANGGVLAADGDDDDDEPDEQCHANLVPYEIARLNTIASNKVYLASIGLEDVPMIKKHRDARKDARVTTSTKAKATAKLGTVQQNQATRASKHTRERKRKGYYTSLNDDDGEGSNHKFENGRQKRTAKHFIDPKKQIVSKPQFIAHTTGGRGRNTRCTTNNTSHIFTDDTVLFTSENTPSDSVIDRLEQTIINTRTRLELLPASAYSSTWETMEHDGHSYFALSPAHLALDTAVVGWHSTALDSLVNIILVFAGLLARSKSDNQRCTAYFKKLKDIVTHPSTALLARSKANLLEVDDKINYTNAELCDVGKEIENVKVAKTEDDVKKLEALMHLTTLKRDMNVQLMAQATTIRAQCMELQSITITHADTAARLVEELIETLHDLTVPSATLST